MVMFSKTSKSQKSANDGTGVVCSRLEFQVFFTKNELYYLLTTIGIFNHVTFDIIKLPRFNASLKNDPQNVKSK